MKPKSARQSSPNATGLCAPPWPKPFRAARLLCAPSRAAWAWLGAEPVTRPLQSIDSASYAAERLRPNPSVHLTLQGQHALARTGKFAPRPWAFFLGVEGCDQRAELSHFGAKMGQSTAKAGRSPLRTASREIPCQPPKMVQFHSGRSPAPSAAPASIQRKEADCCEQ